MIAILQFDGVSLPHLEKFLGDGRLPTLAALRARGHWLPLETPADSWEGSIYFSLYSGKRMTEHGLYFPFMWSPAEQRVRPQDDFPAPEPVWDLLGRAGYRSLVIDPYEGRQAISLNGKAISGWQFRHKVTLRGWSAPKGLDRELQRRFGRPRLVEEIYGRPSASYLCRMRQRLLEAPTRAAKLTTALLEEEEFDLIWISFSSSHIAGHWFLEASRLPQKDFDRQTNRLLGSALSDSYASVDRALSEIVTALPPDADLIVLSPSGMAPSASRTHLLPGMLKAVLSRGKIENKKQNPAGSFLWRLRAAVPPDARALVARVLPDQLMMNLTARLEMRGTDWQNTRAFMVPSGDCGYIRLNLMGRERDGIVDPRDAPVLLEQIAAGLQTFCGPNGEPAVKKIEFLGDSLTITDPLHGFPDLIVHWSDILPAYETGVASAQFGDVPPAGWGSGRTGEHRDGAWALIVPASCRLRTTAKPAHILDIVPTICELLATDRKGFGGEPLLERALG
jgi:predicted AlkP superfamily phosphohydrolase/phosphomutase